ncbi:hypothetical protein [Stieleria varia]|uniref:Uncharacterized protein n=1 Tax=Stieleria varia TaxID=2528005 RepID=A0A5C6ATG3_9BACT|nr:hypothetical protein [Stieleria varia]TWU02701.1 hypothetical protein Pla52n_37590 [Stieleria varia]
MAGDLEEFLRRAAERRAQKQQQQQQQPAAPPPPPQQSYTNSRTERQVRPAAEEVVMAEIVEEPVNAIAERQRQVAEARKRAEVARKKLANSKRSVKHVDEVKVAVSVDETPTGITPEALIAMLRRPGGLQQAILLREILERPERNW